MSKKAVYFDGATWVQNDNVAGFPASSPYGFISLWYNQDPGVSGTLIRPTSGTGAPHGTGISISLGTGVSVSGGIDGSFIAFGISTPTQPTIQGGVAPRGEYGVDDESVPWTPFSPGWHHVALAYNTRGTVTYTPTVADDGYVDHTLVNIWVDGVPQSVTINEYPIDSSSPDPLNAYTPFDVTLGSSWVIGDFQGSMAEVFVLMGVDAMNPPLDRFIDLNILQPVPIDAGGLYPFFNSTGDVPQIFLSGDEDLFPRNYPGWSATCVSQTDSMPTSTFYDANPGALQTASDDPFGPPIS